ncbi:hypothetical protein ACQKIE_04780 [Luteibacter sp. NPDC031894]|jgi:hypothetical protein|uniref:hypothetical protein n=1 Tax=Luteibacter sp. NPDC031894 TaxID=3390572 RepID=UPI003D02A1D6
MEKLSRLQVPPEWEAALIACLDVPPRRPRERRWVLIVCLVLVVFAGIAGIAVWVGR